MKIFIGSDHAGFNLKADLIEFLKMQNHEVIDSGTYSSEPVDYPDYAEKVALKVRENSNCKGILICGSGVGVSVAANKIPGIRAAICHDSYSAHQGVEHDNMNILVMGARIIGVALAEEIAVKFIAASFSNEPRHVRRLEKVLAIESKYLKQLSERE